MKIGYITLSSLNYYSSDYLIHQKYYQVIEQITKSVGFELADYKTDIQSLDDYIKIEDDLKKLDALLIMFGSFADGNIATYLDKLKKPFVLLSVPEIINIGDIKLHSVVTQALFSSILKKNYNKNDMLFINGSLFEKEVQKEFVDSLFAIKTLIKIQNSKICQIGKESSGFINLKEDINSLKSKFGVTIDKMEIDDVLQNINSFSIYQINKVKSKLLSKSNIMVTDEEIEKTIKVYLSLRKIVIDNDYSAIAVNCWPEFQEKLNIVPCVAFSMLTEYDNIPVSCEGDIGGALSMLILNQLSNEKPTLMDITQIDKKHNAVQFWHCGFSPMSLSKGRCSIVKHPMMNRRNVNAKKIGCSFDFVLNMKEVTILRISGKQNDLFIASGRKTILLGNGFTGTRLWLKKLRINDKYIDANNFLNFTLDKGIEHHYAICKGYIIDRIKLYKKISNL